jgi:hypothetical protein
MLLSLLFLKTTTTIIILRNAIKKAAKKVLKHRELITEIRGMMDVKGNSDTATIPK